MKNILDKIRSDLDIAFIDTAESVTDEEEVALEQLDELLQRLNGKYQGILERIETIV